MDVYLSHLGEAALGVSSQPESLTAATLRALVQSLNQRYPGLWEQVVTDDEQLRSSVLVVSDIEVHPNERWLTSPTSVVLTGLDQPLAGYQTLLLALFDPDRAMACLRETLTADATAHLSHASGHNVYQAFLSAPEEQYDGRTLWCRAEAEALYPFRKGRPLSELITEERLNVAARKLLPTRLRDAIADLWELDSDFCLRLFQEESLSHILQELHRNATEVRRPLLLSIPTGGGKTEAFLIPLIAHLYDRRVAQVQEPRVRTLILYPTRALANDQAQRIAEILYRLNKGALEPHQIAMGVLTGDTPSHGYNLTTEQSLLQLCPACGDVLTEFYAQTRPDRPSLTLTRCLCGAEVDFFRLTRQDILTALPDLLITSPDMLNQALQSPRYHRLFFSSEIEAIVFDEIHTYQSIFGCNVAHLLRRVEEACGKKPLYIGVSATIRNARALASLVFDCPLEEIRYLRPVRKGNLPTEEERPYLEYAAPPTRYRYHYAVAPATYNGRFRKTVTSTLNLADALGHLIRAPHFRKILIFANFRQETDDLVRFLRDQEARYYLPYQTRILPKLLAAQESQGSTATADLSKAEVDIALTLDRWYRHAWALGCDYRPPLEIGWHRGGLEKAERLKAVNRFSATRRLTPVSQGEEEEWPIDVMVATSTLELGLDIGDVTTVINNSAPLTTNEYIQRVGRGGRRRDSLAVTVVNPTHPMDLYFLRHFERYAHPSVEDFEDAPIIISNEAVLESHLYARLLDWLAKERATDKGEVLGQALQQSVLTVSGRLLIFQEAPAPFAAALFEALFTPARVEALERWVQREAEAVPGVRPISLNRERLLECWTTKLVLLHERLTKGDIRESDPLSGLGSKARELVPDMRQAGPQVGLFLVRERGEDELRDTLPRHQAVTARPLGGFATQGSVTYRVEGLKERDGEAERAIKSLFQRSEAREQAADYFHRMFGDANAKSPFPADPFDVVVDVDFQSPKDLLVKYHPYRFYCPRCGATYAEKQAGSERCSHCWGELRQVTELYTCGGCGELYLPPIPKVCINPACVAESCHQHDGTPFLESLKRIGGRYQPDYHNHFFRFTALPRLTWQCRRCNTEVNYHAHYTLHQAIKAQLDGATFGGSSPASVAKHFLFMPESWYRKGYDERWYRACFACPRCKKTNSYKKIQVVNIPTHRSVVPEFIIPAAPYAPPLDHALGEWSFLHVSVLALAREMYRRYYSYADDASLVRLAPIFTTGNSYLGNTYRTHAVFLKLAAPIERFLDQNPRAQAYILGREEVGRASGTWGEAGETVESSELTLPHPALLPWEMERKPDPRRMWCDVVKGRVLGSQCQDVACTSCRLGVFDRRRFTRYLVLHTLKHAIIHALPRYTGANKNSIRGYLYPNDELHYDLALVDRIVGGSGCLYLLRTNWDAIWQMVGELLEVAQAEQSQLLLPYTCSRYNRDLDAALTFDFYRFVQGAGS